MKTVWIGVLLSLLAVAAYSGDPEPGSTRDDARPAANFAGYLLLHQTWDQNVSAPATARLRVCLE